MKESEFTDTVESIIQEVRKRLLDGRFEVTSVFNQGFGDVYDLRISRYNLRLSISNNGKFISITDSFFSFCFTSEECERLYMHIQVGGIRKCLELKKQQIEVLTKDVQNLSKMLED